MKRDNQITIRIASKHKDALIKWAERDGCTVADIVNGLIIKYYYAENKREKQRQQALNSESNDITTDDS